MDQVPISPSGNEPWWTLLGGSAVGLVLIIAKAYFYIRGRLNKVQTQEKEGETKERESARRAAASEAWELNARLMEIIKASEAKDEERNRKHEATLAQIKKENEEEKKDCQDARRKCEVEYAEMCGRLSVVEAWARKKGMPLEDPQHGSGSHASLGGV